MKKVSEKENASSGRPALIQSRSGVYERLVTLLFPRRCPFCDKVVPYGTLVHPTCLKKVDYADRYNTCLKCGKPMRDSDDEYCRDCLNTAHVFDRGFSLYIYRTVSGAVYRFKYGGRQEYADFFAKDTVRHLGAAIRAMNIDMIVPVPLHRKRQNVRGYNQAYVLARAIGTEMGILVSEKTVKRVRNTIPQKKLDAAGRCANLKRAFIVNGNDVKLKKILIIDDIYTTGATVDHIAWQLKKSGASEVCVLTLSIGG
jgi:ComF family protein